MSEDKVLYNLTNPQKSIWYTGEFYKDTSITNVCGTNIIDEIIDADLLEKAMNLVAKNNDILRVKFCVIENEPKQYFEKYIPFKVDIIYIKNEIELNKYIENIAKIKMSELYKFNIFKFEDGTGAANILINHLMSDAWSTTLIANEVINVYEMLKENNVNEEDISSSYIEYIESEKEYMNSEKYVKDKEFWEEKYNVLPEIATFIKDNSERKTEIKAIRKEIIIDKDISEKINKYCKENRISAYVLYLALYSIYLSRVNGIDKIVIGTPILNRKNIKEKKCLGMFVNTLPVDICFEDKMTVQDLFKEVSQKSLSIFRHQKYSFFELVKYIRKRHQTDRNIYDVIFSYQNAKIDMNETDIEYKIKWNFNGNISESVNIHVSDLNELGEYNIYYDYQVDKFSNEDIQDIHNRIMYMLEQIMSNNNIKIDDIDIVTKEEKEYLLKNYKIVNYPNDKTIVDLFKEQVNKTPHNIAVKINNHSMTYLELDEKSNELANYLISKGIKRQIIVGLRLDKSLEMIIGILGIIKAGACYLPINLSYPEERVSFMLKDSNAKLLLTNNKCKDDIKLDMNMELIDLNNDSIYNNENNINVLNINQPDDLLYIIYTSGSTGNPKGAMITHRNVVRLMKNDSFLFDFNKNDVWTMFHSVAFDFSVWEMYGALLYGGKLVLVDDNIARNPIDFLKLLRKEKVTILNQTPTYFYNLLENELKMQDSNLAIRYIIFGGEELKPNLTKSWKEKYKFTKLINMYGITETTVHVTFKELLEEDLSSNLSNIGVPIPTMKVYIMDKKHRLLPFGIEGEMNVSGLGLCNGYLNREELNNEKFINNPYNENEKLYCSGDSAILNKNGELYYKGRIDSQVKIRGFRVELGEIESKLLKHPSISKCVVLEQKKTDKDSQLVAYIVCKEYIAISDLKQYMSKIVPTYMIPNFFVKVDDIPLNVNGKVDRKKLKLLNYTIDVNNNYIKPRNDFEKSFKDIVEKALNIKNVSINDDILQLGADSLTLMKVTAKLFEIGYDVSLQSIYENKTIEKISNDINLSKDDNENSISTNLHFEFTEDFIEEKINIDNILITGATGFLGAHLLYDIIVNTNSNVYCLIREKDGIKGKERLINKLRYYFGEKLLKHIDKRIFVVSGNLVNEKLELSENEYNDLGKKINLVIHSAAIVDHYGQKEIFEKVNLHGTENIFKFCNKFNIPLNHISTISVLDFKNEDSAEAFDEHLLYTKQENNKNIYIKTKYQAEYYLWKQMKSGANIAIYRLGNITARYSDGVFQENDYQNAFSNRIIAFTKLKKVPKEILDLEIDFSPVDECSKIITNIMQYKSSYNKVFHILNNNKIKIKEIINILDKNIEVIPFKEFRESIKNDNQNNIMGIINDITSVSITEINKQVILEDFTIKYLNMMGIKWKDIDDKYIEIFFAKFM